VPDRHAWASGPGAIDRILRCPGLADHRVPVMTDHMPGGKPESVAKTRTARLRRSACLWTTSRSSGRPTKSPKTGSRGGAAAAAKAGHPLAGTAAQVKTAIYDHALSVGFGRGLQVSAGIMLVARIITIAAVRVRRAGLAGAQTAPGTPAADEASAEMAEAGQSGRAGPRGR
jgi:hypothetical protein